MKTLTTNINYCKIGQYVINDEKAFILVDKDIDGEIHRVMVPVQRVNLVINFSLLDENNNEVQKSGAIYTIYEGEDEKTKEEVEALVFEKIAYYRARTKYEQAGYIVPGFEEADFIIK